MERKREERERPRFTLSGSLAFDLEAIIIGQPKVGLKTWHIRVLKALLKNEGELLAQNAKAHIGFGDSGLAWPTIWTTHGSWREGEIILTAPPILGDDIEAARRFIAAHFFGDPFWTNDWNRDIMSGSTHAAVILYTIEGSGFAYPISEGIRPLKLPLEAQAALSIGMENAKPSQTITPKFRITAWDKFDEL